MPTVVAQRSVRLNQWATEFVKDASAEEYGTFNIEGEGKESLYRYTLPDGQVVREIFCSGLRLGLVDLDDHVVPESR